MGVLDTRSNSSSYTKTNQIRPLKKTSPLNLHLQDLEKNKPPHESRSFQDGSKITNPLASENALFSAEEIGFDKGLGIITAKGNVEIIHGGTVLIADTVSYNQSKDMVTASGNVQLLKENGDVIFSEFMDISSDLREGVIRELVFTLADQSHITAKDAKRSKGRFTVLTDATYSPCHKCITDPEKMSFWKLNAKEILHDAKQQRLEYSDVFLEVLDAPVLYFPYFTHPDPSKKRETGLLTPTYGSQGQLGSFINAPVFVNLSPSKDITLAPTWFIKEDQALLEAEYRHLTDNGKLRVAGSVTYANGGPGATKTSKEEFRGHIDSEGLFDIDQTWRWGFNLNHASDDTYIRRYSMKNNADNGHLTSDLYIEGFRDRNYMNTSITNYQEQKNVSIDNLQDGKVEYQFNHISQPQDTGAYWSLDGGFYSIKRNSNTLTNRLAADTSWTLPYTSNDGDIYSLKANLAAMAYYSSNLEADGLSTEYSGAQARLVPNLSFSWRKPLTKSHMAGRVNEVFEPIVNLKVAPNVGDNNKIPNEDSIDFEFDDTNLFKTNRFSGLDKYDGGQRIDYGFNWGIYGEDGGYSQMFIGQSYRLRDDNTYDSFSGLEDNLSDIVGRVKVSPSNFLDILYRYRLDKNDLRLNRSETALSMGPKASRFTLSHLFIKGTGEDSEYSTREEIYGTLKNQISKNWYSKIDSRYRMNDPKGNVTYGGQLGYKNESITVYADVRRNFYEDRDIEPEDLYTIRIELKNLGGFSSLSD